MLIPASIRYGTCCALQALENVAGPCVSGEHFMLPAQERCRGILKLIDQKQYFVIHAARQSGKTTLLLELTDHVNASGDYYAVYCSLETLRRIADPAEGIPIIRSVCFCIDAPVVLNK